MRKIERMRQGVPALLAQAKVSPVLLTYRGVDATLEDIFEVKAVTEVNTVKGEVLCQMVTEQGLLEGLIKIQPHAYKGRCAARNGKEV
jgi:hypothetical protein